MGFDIQSAQTRQTISEFTSVVNKAIINAKNEVDLSCSVANNIAVLIGNVPLPSGDVIPCKQETNVKGGLTISQKADASCNISGQFSNSFQTAITNNVKSEVQQWITDKLKDQQGWLAIAFSAQVAQNESAASVSTTLSNGLTANIQNTCSGQLFASNNAIVSICGLYEGNFNFEQSAFVTNLTSCVANNVVNFVANNSILNQMAQKADTELASSQEGIGILFKWIIIAAIILGVVILVGVLLYFIFGNKSSPKTQVPRALGLEGREILSECTTAVRERYREEGRSFDINSARSAIESCILKKKREEGRSEARSEREPRYEREGPREESRYEPRYERDRYDRE